MEYRTHLICLLHLVEFYVAAFRFSEAEEVISQALAVCEKRRGTDRVPLAWTYQSMASYYAQRGEYEPALTLGYRALAALEEAPRLYQPYVAGVGSLNQLYVAMCLMRLSKTSLAIQRTDLAQPACHRALAILEKMLGPDHPEVAFGLVNLGELYRQQDKLEEAERLLTRAVATLEKSLGDQFLAGVLDHLARVQLCQGRIVEAKEKNQRSVAILEETFGAGHPTLNWALRTHAAILMAEGNYAEAERVCLAVLESFESVLLPEHAAIAETLEQLAELLRRTGRGVEATPVEARAQAIRAKHRSLTLSESDWPEEAADLNPVAEPHARRSEAPSSS